MLTQPSNGNYAYEPLIRHLAIAGGSRTGTLGNPESQPVQESVVSTQTTFLYCKSQFSGVLALLVILELDWSLFDHFSSKVRLVSECLLAVE